MQKSARKGADCALCKEFVVSGKGSCGIFVYKNSASAILNGGNAGCFFYCFSAGRLFRVLFAQRNVFVFFHKQGNALF